eukprot:jgi/Galph1/3867/GphlegSOOS_G2567.1
MFPVNRETRRIRRRGARAHSPQGAMETIPFAFLKDVYILIYSLCVNGTSRWKEWLLSLCRPHETFSAWFQRGIAALLQSVGSKLEIMAFIHAILSLIIVWTLHVQFVMNDGCGWALESLLRNCSDKGVADVLQIQIVGQMFESNTLSHTASASVANCQFWRAGESKLNMPTSGWLFPSKRSVTDDILEAIFLKPTIYRYSLEKGLLLLNQEETWRRHHVSFASLQIDSDHFCLGNWFLRKLVLESFVGYDTILMNSLAKYFQYRGYVLHLRTGNVINLQVMFEQSTWGSSLLEKTFSFLLRKLNILITSIFMMSITGTLVTFALREVRARVMKLNLELQQRRVYRTSITGLLIRYSLEGAVFVPIITGILFFLLEFFDDYLIAFLVLVLAWTIFVYFLAFHIYFFTFPCGFAKEALYVCAAFMQHAVLVAWNRWEAPFLRSSWRQVSNQ